VVETRTARNSGIEIVERGYWEMEKGKWCLIDWGLGIGEGYNFERFFWVVYWISFRG
jgi:hypothetical protein